MGTVRPKKFLGQHFLKDLGIAGDIADTVDACPEIPVLEVGPGMGVLTQFLTQNQRFSPLFFIKTTKKQRIFNEKPLKIRYLGAEKGI